VEMCVVIILATNIQYAIYKRLTLKFSECLELFTKMVCVYIESFKLKMKNIVCENKFGTKYYNI
jgi:hypothetical protein